MSSRRLLVLLCVTMAANTCSVGAFPALLPELGAGADLSDWQLGTVAAAWGFARMLADVPVGLFITHHLRRALALAPVVFVAGALCLASGGSFPVLVLGRGLMGIGHTLGMLGGLTAILRHTPERALASALNALEFSAMLGMVGGVTLLAGLPRSLAWNLALVVTCAPVLLSVLLVPALLRTLPALPRGAAAPLFARTERRGGATGSGAGLRSNVGLGSGTGRRHSPAGRTPVADATLVALAFVAGGAIAVSYSSVEQFAIPLRGSREFGLDRVGIARLLLLMQVCDVVALLPVGALADRHGPPRLLAVLLVVFAVALALIGFGGLPLVVAGTALFGLSMAGWMLPLGVLRAVTPTDRVAWRTALYRVSVDGGIFLGPFVSGLLAGGGERILPATLAVALAVVGVLLLRSAGRPPRALGA